MGKLEEFTREERALASYFSGRRTSYLREAADPESDRCLDMVRRFRYEDQPLPCHGASFVTDMIAEIARSEIKEKLADYASCLDAVLFCRAGFRANATNGANQRSCCELFEREFASPKSFVVVASMIKGTYNRFPFRKLSGDAAYVADASNAMYGREFDIFNSYRISFEQEFLLFYPQQDANKATRIFRKKWKHMLEKLFVQSEFGVIYRTPEFRERYEQQAAANIRQMLRVLNRITD